VKRLATHFNKDLNYYKTVAYDNLLSAKLERTNMSMKVSSDTAMMQQSVFDKRPLSNFQTYEEAYHQLMIDIMTQQVFSTKLVLAQTPVKKIFVDGGFSKNDVFMHLLASAFPDIKVYAANIAQASALGAALVLHDHLSKENIPSGLIDLKYYPVKNNIAI